MLFIGVHPKFQFQSGAIKGYSTQERGSSVRSTFQFQSGAIKGRHEIRKLFKAIMFQFQSGAIKGDVAFLIRSDRKFVSIPIWCD
jgi:hypothetical protein